MKKESLFKMALMFALLIGAFICCAPAEAADLNDVTGTPYSQAFDYLIQKGIVSGYQGQNAGQGLPYNYLTRAEALKVLMGAQKRYEKALELLKENNTIKSGFSDVKEGEWYTPYVLLAHFEKYVIGYSDGTYRPHRQVTTEEAVALLMRIFEDNALKQETVFSDEIQNRAGEWYTPYINTAISRNLVNEADRLYLGAPITRGQFFNMVYRMLYIREHNLAAFDPVLLKPGAVTETNPVRQEILQFASDKSFAITMPTLAIHDLEVIHPENPFTDEGVLSVLSRGIGHLFKYPGMGGKILLYGHSSNYAYDVSQYSKIFREINRLNNGDRIYVTYKDRLFVYQVDRKQTIPAAQTDYLREDQNGEELILYTCWPPYSVESRYLVHLKPVMAVDIVRK